jgi:hypothetical protein
MVLRRRRAGQREEWQFALQATWNEVLNSVSINTAASIVLRRHCDSPWPNPQPFLASLVSSSRSQPNLGAQGTLLGYGRSWPGSQSPVPIQIKDNRIWEYLMRTFQGCDRKTYSTPQSRLLGGNQGHHGLCQRLCPTAPALDQQYSVCNRQNPIQGYFVRYRHSSTVVLLDALDVLKQHIS